MEITPKLAFFIIVFCIFAFFLVDVGYTSFMSGDMDDSLDNAIKSSMQKSVNKGYLRVTDDMTTDKSKFIDNYNQSYRDNQSVKNANFKVNFYKVSEFPPMAAVEVFGQTDSYFNRFMGQDAKNVYYKKQIVIMEKK